MKRNLHIAHNLTMILRAFVTFGLRLKNNTRSLELLLKSRKVLKKKIYSTFYSITD